MDFFDQRILAALKDGKPRGFTAILDEVGFSHNTLQRHLKRLVEKGLILKEKDPASGFEKGGYCKEKKTSCSPQNCPQIRKEK